MRAVTWQGKRKVSVDTVPDPVIEQKTDAIVEITTTNICGSDLHLYEVLGAFMNEGDILGHEPMGIVREVGSEVTDVKVGDRVVIPFQISCGSCHMCDRKLFTQCEITQIRDEGMGAALFGYSKLYGSVPGGQAEYLRVPHVKNTHIKVPEGPPDSRFVYLSDVLPTAWQAVEYAEIPDGGSVVVLGLGPIGDMAARIAAHKVFGSSASISCPSVSPVRGRDGSRRSTSTTRGRTRRRDPGDDRRPRPDSVIDAVGMEAHGSPGAKLLQQVTSYLPDAIAAPLISTAGIDRLHALYSAIDIVRRGGTLSLIGVYGGMADPIPMLTLFDKQIQLRMGQANVKRWVPDILPLLTDADPLGVDTFATHELPLDHAPHAYEIFQKKEDGAVKILLKP